MLAPATTAIFSAPVGKLPMVERLPAIPGAAGAASVNTVPAAFEPTATSSFRDTGDSSPVIFAPAAGRAVAVSKPRQGGPIPTVPAADAAAGFTSTFRKRILLSSLHFCHRNQQRFARTNFPQPVIARMPSGPPEADARNDKRVRKGQEEG